MFLVSLAPFFVLWTISYHGVRSNIFNTKGSRYIINYLHLFSKMVVIQCILDSYNCIIIDCQYAVRLSCGCYEALEETFKKNAILFLHLGLGNGDKQYCQPAWKVIFVVCRLVKSSSIYTLERDVLWNQNKVTPLNNLKHCAISKCDSKWTLESLIKVCTNITNGNVTGAKVHVNYFSCHSVCIGGKNLRFILRDGIKNF